MAQQGCGWFLLTYSFLFTLTACRHKRRLSCVFQLSVLHVWQDRYTSVLNNTGCILAHVSLVHKRNLKQAVTLQVYIFTFYVWTVIEYSIPTLSTVPERILYRHRQGIKASAAAVVCCTCYIFSIDVTIRFNQLWFWKPTPPSVFCDDTVLENNFFI